MNRIQSTLILGAALLAIAFTGPVTADHSNPITVTWQFDASATAPFPYATSESRCTVTVDEFATAGDAFDAAVLLPECGITSYRETYFDLGSGPVRFVESINGAQTACMNDPTGSAYVCRFWAFYQNHLAADTGIDETPLADGDVLGFNYELSYWPVNVPNPATVYWLAGQDYQPLLA